MDRMSDPELSKEQSELDEIVTEYSNRSLSPMGTINEEQDEGNCYENKITSVEKALFGDKQIFIKTLSAAVTTLKSDQELELQGYANVNKKRKPAWTDVDDEEIQLSDMRKTAKYTGSLNTLGKDKPYKEYLNYKFKHIISPPKWASLDDTNLKNGSDEEGEELLRSVGFLDKSPGGSLSPNHIKFSRLKDLNRATYGEGPINSIAFHPSSTAAIVAGEKGIASIYAIDGVQNDKLHNIHIPKFPIKSVKIFPCGIKAVFGSTARYAYVYDLMTAKEHCYKLRRDRGHLIRFQISSCGRYLASAGLNGEIHMYEAKTMQLIRTYKQEDEARDISFTADSQRLICNSKGCNVCVFSIRQQKLEHRFIDEGCVAGNVMDLSINQSLLATGTMEGIVNVYDFSKAMQSSTPRPEKSFHNLTTAISCVKFNNSVELLAFSSSKAHNAVKLANFPKATVYANFPNNGKFGKIRTLEFSPKSGYLALGSYKEVPLLKLNHFQDY
uniref:WD40 repeat protein n=1 Tax=Glossina morsitans morsitans TaxID=37546 RepID=D3TP25_GLOMM